MNSYAVEILNKEFESEDQMILEILVKVKEKKDIYGLNALSDSEMVIYVLGLLEMEVNNGGFEQYFFNTDGMYIEETFVALEKIGAMKTSEQLQKAVEIYYDNDDEDDELTDTQQNELNEIDKWFYNYIDNLAKLQIYFINNNITNFTLG